MPDDERRAVNMANNSSWSGLPADNDITSGTSAIVESMHRTTRIPISELNRHLLCALCSGYLIDATTIIECLHSFCKTCILRYLETSKYCPICDVQVHKTKPHVNIRSDHTLQNVVYKLVPNLFKQEMHMRRVFYVANPTAGPSKSSVNALEARGEMSASDRGIITEDDKISLILQRCSELPPYKNGVFFTPAYKDEGADQRYLRCPAGINISHLKKFLKLKFELAEQFQIEIFHSDESLNDKYSLMDVAYIYGWRRLTPLKLYYIAIDMSKDKIDLAALSHPSLYMYHISLMRSRKRKKSSISTAASTPTVGTSDDEAPVPKVQRANNNDDKALFRPISCDAGSRASPADGAAARSPTITSLLTSSVSSSFVSRSGLTKAAISHAVVAVRTSPVVHAHNTFRTSTPLSRQDVGGGSKRSVQIDTPQPRRGAVVGDAAGSSPMTSQTPESAAASSTSLPPNGRSASKKGTVSGKQKDGPEKEKKKKKDKEKVKNKSVSSSTGLVQIRRALPKDMVNAKPSTSHKGNCDSSNAFASLITTSSVSGTPSTTITASLSTPKSNSDTVSGTKKRSPTVTIRMVKTQDGEKVFSVERTSYDDSGSDTCIEDNVPSPPPPCVPTSEPSAAPKDTTEAAPAKHTSDGNATALGTSSDAAVSSVSTAISKVEETVMLKTAGTVNVSATNTSSQCKVTAVSAPNSTNLTNVSKDNINATDVFGLATSSPALDKAVCDSSTSSEKSQASNVLSNSGTMSKSVQNQSNVIPVLDRIASEKAATDKAASEKAQMISDKMATYKLIKPKASLNKEKSINAIASVLGEKKNIKNKSKTANVKDSKPAKQAKRKNDDVIVTSCFKQYNAMQRDPLAVNTGTSESAAKPSPNMIPSLSSPRSATCVSSSETQFLGSDKGVTLSTMDPSELIVTSAGIQNNNHKPPSMENVAVEENDSPVLVNSKPPASREETYKLMGPPPSMCTPHPLPSIGQTKVIKLNGPKNPITSPSVTAAVSTAPSTLKLPTHINPAEMQNYQAPQPCKRRGTYAKRPTKAALAAMNQAAGKPSKMAKMAETLNARRGRQPIPIPGRAPDRSMFDMRRLPANLGPMNPNVIQQAMQTVMMGHTLNGSQAMPAMMSPNGIHYMPPGNLQVPAVSMMTDRPGTPMVPGHSAPGAVLHQAMTSPPASHAPANARLSTPLSLASNGKSPLASPSAFSSPPIHTFMSPTHTPLANRPPFNGIPPNAPPTAQPNGYDAPLDFTTKRSSLPDSGKSPPKAHMSPAEKRTLLKVPNPMANRL